MIAIEIVRDHNSEGWWKTVQHIGMFGVQGWWDKFNEIGDWPFNKCLLYTYEDLP